MMDEQQKAKALMLYARAFNGFDTYMHLLKPQGLPPLPEEITRLRNNISEVRELDPIWAALLEESYAEYLGEKENPPA